MTPLYNHDPMAGRPASKQAPPFGRRLAAARKAKGLSQVQLAGLLGTTQKTIDYYERRATNPTLEVVERAARALEVPVAELLDLDVPASGQRRGPAPRLLERFERIQQLPRKDREFVINFIDTYLQRVEGRG